MVRGGRSGIAKSPTGRRFKYVRPLADRDRNKKEWYPSVEDITVCVISAKDCKCLVVDDVPNRIGDVSKLINNGKPISRRYLHVTPVTVGVHKEHQKTYGVMYAFRKDYTEQDETVVFRSEGRDGANLFTGMPLGDIVVFTFDNRRIHEPTRPGTLTEEDVEFITAHTFTKDGRIFLMAEARKGY